MKNIYHHFFFKIKIYDFACSNENKRAPTIMLPPTRNAAKLFQTRSISFRCCFKVSLVSPERQNIKNFFLWIYLNSTAIIS